VKCIEHGHLMDEATAALIAKRGVWLSIQPFPEELAEAFPPGSEQRAKFAEVLAGMDRAYKMARKYKSLPDVFRAGLSADPPGASLGLQCSSPSKRPCRWFELRMHVCIRRRRP
jgi:hypothetical protein